MAECREADYFESIAYTSVSWQLRRGRSPQGWLFVSLEWSNRWAMFDVFVVALAVHAHVAAAVYPHVAAIGPIVYAARAVSAVRGAQQAT